MASVSVKAAWTLFLVVSATFNGINFLQMGDTVLAGLSVAQLAVTLVFVAIGARSRRRGRLFLVNR
jgi:hypothetical protein